MTVVCICWLKLLKTLYQSTARVATSLSLVLRSVCSSETYVSTCPARDGDGGGGGSSSSSSSSSSNLYLQPQITNRGKLALLGFCTRDFLV